MFIKGLFIKIRQERLYQELDKSDNILIVGAGGRNDWKFLEERGFNITVLDIKQINGPKNFIKASITEQTVFKNNYFDVVIFSTVLEYVIDDIAALKEAKRILKNNGKLILDLEYLCKGSHLLHRVYTPKTIIDILKYVEFNNIVNYEHRGIFGFLYHKKLLKSIFLLPLTLFSQDIKWWIKFEIYISNKFKIIR